MQKRWKIISLGSNEELERHLNQVSAEGATVVSVQIDQYPTAAYYFEDDEGADPELEEPSHPAKGKKKGSAR